VPINSRRPLLFGGPKLMEGVGDLEAQSRNSIQLM